MLRHRGRARKPPVHREGRLKKFTRFAPFGHGAHPGEPLGKQIYRSLLESHGYDENFSGDAYLKGKLFAEAMIAASAVLINNKAKAELHSLSTSQFLELHELENGVVATAGQTKRQRRALLNVLKRLTLNGRVSTIHQTLQELLGDALVGYRTIRASELNSAMKTPNPRGNQADWETPLRIVTLDIPVVKKNVALRVPATFAGGDSERFSAGQKVVVSAGTYSRSEVVTLLAADTLSITAKFQKPHCAGASVVGGHHPRHWSGKRTHLVMLRDGAASDATITGQVNVLMRRLVKGSAVWRCIDETTPFTSGPFTVNGGLLGRTTIGATTV